MNYYGIWISFTDKSNLFYDPDKMGFVRHPQGEPMPSEFFFTLSVLDKHKRKVETLVDGLCMDHAAELHLSEIRPQDPDWNIIYAHRHPPLYPGGPPEASNEDFPDDRDGPQNPW